MENLSKDIAIDRVQNAAAAGTTTLTTSAVDMQGFDGVIFVAAFGTITDGTPAIKARQGAQSNMSDGADLAGTSTALALTDDNKLAVLDVCKPTERYVACQVVRGGSTGAVVDGVIAIRYYANKKPTVQGTTVGAIETHISPAEGTA